MEDLTKLTKINLTKVLDPDTLYSKNIKGETFYYTIKKNFYSGYEWQETHAEMLKADKNLFYEVFPDSEKCFTNNFERNYFLDTPWLEFVEYDPNLGKDNECTNSDSTFTKIKKYLRKNKITEKKIAEFGAYKYGRLKALMFGNLLGRYGVYNDVPVISFWNDFKNTEINMLESLFVNEEFLEQLKIIFSNYPSSEWKVAFKDRTSKPFNYFSNIVYVPKKTKKIKTSDSEVVPDEKIKILDKEFTINQLQNMRSNLHVRSSIVDPSIPIHTSQYFKYLCSIDAKKYPHIKGYKPVGCPSKTSVKYEPTTRDIMKKSGYPYYGTYGESFKIWLKSIE